MKAIDKIIGYSGIKGELMQISDTLKNNEIYKKLGVSAPRGLLLFGAPGVGKSLMASAVIEGGTTFVMEIVKRLKTGQKIKDFTEEDWKDILKNEKEN